MKSTSKFSFLLIAFFLLSLGSYAQQEQVEKYSKTGLLFKNFIPAKINLTFMRFTHVKGNIFLKDASLYYLQDKKIMKAALDNVLSVEFDSVKYVKVGERMGKVVATQGYNQLVCVTTIDVKKMRQQAEEGQGLGFFEIPSMDVFVELDNDKEENLKSYPLKDEYFFLTLEQVIPAVETDFKKIVPKTKLKKFKKLMYDKYWSWKDPTSLIDLFEYIPKNK